MRNKPDLIRAGDQNHLKVKDILINGVKSEEAIIIVDLKYQFVVAYEDFGGIGALINMDRDFFKIIHGDIEIVWHD